MCLRYERWVASPYLVAYILAAPWRPTEERCLHRKEVNAVLTGAVCLFTSPNIPRGTLQTAAHPPCPSPKMLKEQKQ